MASNPCPTHAILYSEDRVIKHHPGEIYLNLLQHYTAAMMTTKIQKQPPTKLIPIVFFGRLEERKGLCTFIEAVKSLSAEARNQIRVYFVGKVVPLYSEPLKHLNSQQYIEQELAAQIPYEISPNFYSREALEFITGLGNPIVCLTSPQENFPNSALETGQLPVSLVVSDTGGFRETLKLIERSSGLYWFTPKDARSLSEQLAKALANYPETPTIPNGSAIAQVNRDLMDRKLQFIEQAFGQQVNSEPQQQPKVTIGVVYPGGEYLTECLASLEGQTYANLEVIVLSIADDEKSQDYLAHAQTLFPNYKFLPAEPSISQSTGAACNYLVSLTTSDYFLPIYPGYVLLPFAVEKFVTAAMQSHAALVTCPRKYFGTENGIVTFPGGSLPSLLMNNLCGDPCSLFSKKLLHQFKYIEAVDVQTRGWEIMAAAVATGESIAHYPYPLFECQYELTAIPPSSKDQYFLRQYLTQIPPDQWMPRQLYMLMTAVQQLQSKPQPAVVVSDTAEIERLRAQLQETRQKLQKVRSRLQKCRQDSESATARIAAMETSKFWQFRKTWFKVKRKIGLPSKE